MLHRPFLMVAGKAAEPNANESAGPPCVSRCECNLFRAIWLYNSRMSGAGGNFERDTGPGGLYLFCMYYGNEMGGLVRELDFVYGLRSHFNFSVFTFCLGI